MTDTYTADTLLAVDFGTATTRALLFDVVEGHYRFLASGEAASTLGPPYFEASEGMRHALNQLQTITGRTVLDETAAMIMPATADGSGVDGFVATSSAGPIVRAVIVGLLPDVSLESVRRAADSTYISVVEKLSLGDHRRQDQQIDAVLAAKPHLILIGGGTDGGAGEALLKLVEVVGLACHLLPPDAKARVLYLGNAALTDKVTQLLSGIATVYIAPNVQPELGEEVLAPARIELGKVFEELRLEQIGGLHALSSWTGGRILPTAPAEAQTIRLLSRILDSAKSVLGVSVGSASTALATAVSGELHSSVCPDLGVGLNAAKVLEETSLNDFLHWLPFEFSEAAAREFILNKSLYPHTLPMEVNDLYLEHALARQVIRATLRRARRRWPHTELLPAFDLIIGSGAVLGRLPRPGTAALILLDALQPTGFTRLSLDAHHLLAALGALSYVHPLAVAQVMETEPLVNLGPAFSLVGRARMGEVICQVRLVSETGAEAAVEIKSGSLEVLSLPPGQQGKLTLKPRPGIDAGSGPGRSRTRDITGGVAGVMIDGRGRPIVFPTNPEKRYETVQQWIWKVGGV
jgi:hypothetical protein